MRMMEHRISFFLAPAEGAGALGCACTTQVIRDATPLPATGVPSARGAMTDVGQS